MSASHHGSGRRAAMKGVLAVAAAPAIITSARAQAKVNWKVQAVWPKASASFKGSLGVLADQLAARTDGRFTLELLGAGEITTGPEIFNVVRRGVVPMGSTSPSYNLGESELHGLYYGVPGTLRNPWELMYLTKNLGLEAALNRQVRSKGVLYLADKAYPTELVLKKPLEPGESLAGIKVRSAGTLLEYLAAAGFAPQYVAGPELYQSLATGVVDGAHWGASVGATTMKLYEVAKTHMKPSLSITNDVYVINVAAYEKLPDDLRLIFTSLVEERYYQRTLEYEREEAVALRNAREKLGVTVQQFPDDVMARLAQGAQSILAKERARGPVATEFVEKLTELMKDLGYV